MFMRTPTNLPAKETDTSNSSETVADPATTSCLGDRRDHARLVCGGPVWWKSSKGDTFEQGWLLERSPDGVAYLTRGRLTVVEGERILLSTCDPTDVEFRTQEGLVARTTHVHADLFLIAAQLKPISDLGV